MQKRALFAAGIFCLLGCICLLSAPEAFTAGIAASIQLCANTLVPAMLPFLVLAGFFVRSGVSAAIGKRLAAAGWACFRLSGEETAVFLASMVSGFPVGVQMIAQLLKSGRISPEQAKRMCMFCFNAGPAFVLSAVGLQLYGSLRAGALLYAALCLSACTVGVLSRKRGKASSAQAVPAACSTCIRFAEAITDSVRSALQTVLEICVWVSLFGGVSGWLSALSLPVAAKQILLSTVEITNGISGAAGQLPLPLIAALLSFGGFSVHGQIFPALCSCQVRYRDFLGGRIVASGFAAAYCALLFRLFPCETAVFGGQQPITHAAAAVSIPSGAALFCMSLLCIAEVESRRKLCYNTTEQRKNGETGYETKRTRRHHTKM